MEVFQSLWYRGVLLFIALQSLVLWMVFGPASTWTGISVVLATFALGPAVAAPLLQRLPPSWLDISNNEQSLHKFFGIQNFGKLLEISGWNRLIANPLRQFSKSKGGLIDLQNSLRGSMVAHGFCFFIHIILSIFSLFTKHPLNGALWMMLPGVFVHFYPFLLQRSILRRIKPLI